MKIFSSEAYGKPLLGLIEEEFGSAQASTPPWDKGKVAVWS
jgi:hypothetical protein